MASAWAPSCSTFCASRPAQPFPGKLLQAIRQAADHLEELALRDGVGGFQPHLTVDDGIDPPSTALELSKELAQCLHLPHHLLKGVDDGVDARSAGQGGEVHLQAHVVVLEHWIAVIGHWGSPDCREGWLSGRGGGVSTQ